MFSPLFNDLVEALRYLPGIGPKSAQRMALHLLQKDRQAASLLAMRLETAIQHIGQCQKCRILTEETICQICADNKRNKKNLCIVENPADVMVLENSVDYKGLYFVLYGHFSPLDGIGPEALGLPLLQKRLEEEQIAEIIIALNTSPEAEITANYIADMAKKHNIQISFLARGVPMGGELAYLDASTLAHAFKGRKLF